MPAGSEPQRLLTAMVAAVVVTSAVVLFAFFVTGDQPSEAVIGWLIITVTTAAVAAGIWFSNREAYASGTAASLANRSLLLGALAIVTPFVAFLGAGPLCRGRRPRCEGHSRRREDQAMRRDGPGSFRLPGDGSYPFCPIRRRRPSCRRCLGRLFLPFLFRGVISGALTKAAIQIGCHA